MNGEKEDAVHGILFSFTGKIERNDMNRNHPGFKKEAEPFFAIIMEGLKDEVEAEHFWDAVREDAVFEFMYNVSGFTNKIEGRKAYMDWFADYPNILYSSDNLRVHKAKDGKTVILEYEVHGIAPQTGNSYDNRFCSIIEVE